MMRPLLRRTVSILWWLLVSVMVVLAVFVVSVKQLLPYLDEYRPQIQKNLTQIIGYSVTLDNINGRLEGIDPTISISNFTVHSSSLDAISIGEIRLRLDTLKSLLTLSPQFSYIRFVRPQVALQERKGVWQLIGAKERSSSKDEVSLDRVLGYLSAQRYFSIIGGAVSLDSEHYGTHSFSASHLYIVHKTGESLLTAHLYVDDYKTPFVLNAHLSESLGGLAGRRIKAFINVPKVDLPLQSILKEKVPGLASIQFKGKLWLDYQVGQKLDVQMGAVQARVDLGKKGQYDLSPSVKLSYFPNSARLDVDVADLSVTDQTGRDYPQTNISAEWQAQTDRAYVSFDQIDLALTHQLARAFINPEWTASKMINGLSPQGLAKNGSVRLWKESGHFEFQYLSNMSNVSVKGYKGIPEATNVDAILSVSENSGYIQFQGTDSKITFDTLYDRGWNINQVSGYVDWKRYQETFVVSGQDLRASRNGAEITGAFRLEVRNDEPDWFSLNLNGKNILIDDRLTYLPDKALTEETRSWVEKAFSGRGNIDNVDLVLQTDLTTQPSPHVRVQMNVRGAEVDYAPDWPKAKNVNGFFELDSKAVAVDVSSADISGVHVSGIKISLPISTNEPKRLSIQGKLEKDAEELLALLKTTPLSKTVLKPFESWKVKNAVSGQFTVSIPLQKTQDDASVNLDLMFKNNPLTIQNLGLSFSIEKGRLHYDSQHGITDTSFDLNVFGGKTRVLIASRFSVNGLEVTGDMSGQADLQQIAKWQKFPQALSKRISGKVGYQGTLDVNHAQAGQVDLVINSDLVGANIQLPSPVGKKESDQKAFTLAYREFDRDVVIDSDYGGIAKSRVMFKDKKVTAGEFLFNSTESFSTVLSNGIVLKGDVSDLDLTQWNPVIADFKSELSLGEQQKTSLLEIPSWLTRVNLIIDEITVDAQNTLHNFKVTYDKKQPAKGLQVNSDELNFILKDEKAKPYLHFGYLSWNTAGSEEQTSHESPIHVVDIPDMTLSIDQLFLNEKPYGDWSLNIKREGERLRIDPIVTKLAKGTFSGNIFWQDGERPNVELNIKVEGGDISELTGKFSNTEFITSKKYDINVALSWEGHPFYFDRQSVSGRISFDSKDGTFAQVDELPAFLKVLGIFNIQALSRRLTLDFSDIYKPGLTYDEVKGILSLNQGVLTTTSPVTISSPTADLEVEGKANIVDEVLDEKLTATFPITSTLPLAGLLLSTPQVAGILYITDKLVGNQLSKVTSVQYKVEGPFDAPVITPIRRNANTSEKKSNE